MVQRWIVELNIISNLIYIIILETISKPFGRHSPWHGILLPLLLLVCCPGPLEPTTFPWTSWLPQTLLWRVDLDISRRVGDLGFVATNPQFWYPFVLLFPGWKTRHSHFQPLSGFRQCPSKRVAADLVGRKADKWPIAAHCSSCYLVCCCRRLVLVLALCPSFVFVVWRDWGSRTRR
jgi:hypothetical protein